MTRVQNPLVPGMVFVRREALLEVGMFDERIEYDEDRDLWLRLEERYGAGCFAGFDYPVCYYWIVQPMTTTQAKESSSLL